MGLLIVLKKISLLFLLISASLLSTSFAGRQWTSMDNPAVETTNKETTRKSLNRDDEAILTEVHERLLGVNAKDYGTYNPSPTFVKPPFKLIPN
ncbi:protein CASPARIAN STRIP INTEGRITY FACTOR 1-like [Telopea speciosissima]|uniref:protein CASPARIAN STRIP INTEGRITY FACTOR 1-like n=1 Tax=Telopea speciosissima TaxID=54955 RepID=UPI001CC77CDE|nr:protein CASPARIAN STRIP INTEGRITY FACTOR 1-like [Telopea speciosissima]